jgi:uncharacterized Zn-finger protein
MPHSLIKERIIMNKMIAYCGLVCTECPAFIATKEDDDTKRKETAEQWSEQFDTTIKLEDINCEGCVSSSEVVFSHPKVCEIRKCGQTKGIINCAYCDEYACCRLNEFFKIVPDAKTTLDNVKKML